MTANDEAEMNEREIILANSKGRSYKIREQHQFINYIKCHGGTFTRELYSRWKQVMKDAGIL